MEKELTMFEEHAKQIARKAVEAFLDDELQEEFMRRPVLAYLADCERQCALDAALATQSPEAVVEAWKEGYGAAVAAFDKALKGYDETVGLRPKTRDLILMLREQAFDAAEPPEAA